MAVFFPTQNYLLLFTGPVIITFIKVSKANDMLIVVQ